VGLAGGGAALAVASVPDSNGVISACVPETATGTTTVPVGGPNLRIIDTNAGQGCTSTGPTTEHSVTWNAAGPQGPTGPAGAQGPAGAPGQTGAAGPAVTVAQGHTFTIAGGQVITVGNSPGVTIAPPPINTRHPVGQVSLGSGAQALLFNVAGLNLVQGGTAASGGGGGAGKAAIHDITITKTVDKSSPTLFKFCANGKHIPKVSISLRKAGRTYLTYKLTDVVISSYQTGGSGNTSQPTESLSLNFTKIEVTYAKQ
jgi:hypothetical protein